MIDIKLLTDQYESAQQFRQQVISDINRWLWLRSSPDIRKTDQTTKSGRSSVTKKLIRKADEWEYVELEDGFLSTSSPIKFYPRTAEDEDLTNQIATGISYQLEEFAIYPKMIKQIIRSLVDKGTAISKQVWIEKRGVLDKQITRKVQQEITAADVLPEDVLGAFEKYGKNLPPQVLNSLSMKPADIMAAITKIGTLQDVGYEYDIVREEDAIIENHPDVEIVDPAAITVDPTAKGDINECQFIIEDKWVSLADLEESQVEYINLDKINRSALLDISQVQSTMPDDIFTKAINFQFSHEKQNKFLIHEYWGYIINEKGKRKSIVATWVDGADFFIRYEDNPYPNGILPYAFSQYMPVEGSFFGQPPAELLEDSQNIVSAATRAVIDVVANNAYGQKGFAAGSMDPVNMKRALNNEHFIFNPNIDPRLAFFSPRAQEVPNSVWNLLNAEQSEAESISGIKTYASDGLSGKSLSDVASANQAVLGAANKRRMSVIRNIEIMLTRIVKQFIMMNSLYLTRDEVVRITNSPYVRVHIDTIWRNVDVKIEVSNAVKAQQDMESIMMLAQTTGPVMHPSKTQELWAKIAEMKNHPELAQLLREPVQEEPNELDIQEKQLGLKLLEAEVVERMSRADENKIDMKLKDAKAQLELVKVDQIRLAIQEGRIKVSEYASGILDEKEEQKEVGRHKRALELQQAKGDPMGNSAGTTDQITDETFTAPNEETENPFLSSFL